MNTKGLKLTKVQKEVVRRFEEGYKLAILSTNRMTGDAYFWVSVNNEGYHEVKEKALYPQLRKLLSAHVIEDSDIITDKDFSIEPGGEGYGYSDLRMAGVNILK